MADCLQLPREVLVQILQLVEVRHRLSSCSLVHSTWAAAALAATDSIHTAHEAAFGVYALLDWLQLHGEQISSLLFWVEWDHVECIPCSNLRSLEINGARLQLERPDSCICIDTHLSNCLAAVTGLTRLELRWCNMSTARDSLSVLSALTDLQHLLLAEVGRPGVDLQAEPYHAGGYTPIPGDLFSQLVQLTHLGLGAGSGGTTQETFRHLGCLSNLQHLGLTSLWTDEPHEGFTDYSGPIATQGLVDLTQLTQLTHLTLQRCIVELTAHTIPQLAPLTNLREMIWDDLWYGSWHPAVLADMQQLQKLVINNQCLEAEGGGTSAGSAALLSALRNMQQLTCLCLHDALEDCVKVPTAGAATGTLPPTSPVAAAAPQSADEERHAVADDDAVKPYAALTASSQLQKLCLTGCTFPAGVWQHAFAPSKLLPYLTSFEAGLKHGFEFRARPLASADVASLVQCCPSLACLQLGKCALEPDASLAPLLLLPELTQLHVHGVQQQAAVDVLMQLTGLEVLKLHTIGDVVGPQHLEAFSGLSSCCVWKGKEYILNVGPA